MPVIPAGSKILVTGGSGFIGAWVVDDAIKRGFTVVAAVRTDVQGKFLEAKYPGKLTYLLVPDILSDTAYDKAVVGVSGIIHVASPAGVTLVYDDPYETIVVPAIKGTIGILKSAKQYGKDVQRVVITSSVLSMSDYSEKEPALIPNTQWNEASPKLIAEKGKTASTFEAYSASKPLAEKAAWDFLEKEKPHFDLSTVHPAWTFGPYINLVASPDKLPSTVNYFYQITTGEEMPEAESSKRMGDYIDVRDTAAHHTLALITPEAGGKRLISSDGTWSWQEAFDAIATKNIPGLVKGTPGKVNKENVLFDSSVTRQVFPDFKWTDFKTSCIDMVGSFVESGFLPKA